MGDLKSPLLIKLKGLLFLLTGLAAVSLILIEHPEIRLAFLLCVAIWSFCRVYYFLFYVIEHYVDAEFRFAGLFAAAQYLWRTRHVRRSETDSNSSTPDA